MLRKFSLFTKTYKGNSKAWKPLILKQVHCWFAGKSGNLEKRQIHGNAFHRFVSRKLLKNVEYNSEYLKKASVFNTRSFKNLALIYNFTEHDERSNVNNFKYSQVCVFFFIQRKALHVGLETLQGKLVWILMICTTLVLKNC